MDERGDKERYASQFQQISKQKIYKYDVEYTIYRVYYYLGTLLFPFESLIIISVK